MRQLVVFGVVCGLMSGCPVAGTSDAGLEVRQMKVVSLGQFAPEGEMTPVRWAPGGRILANKPTPYESWLFDQGAWTPLGKASPDGGFFLGTWLDDTRLAGFGTSPQCAQGITLIEGSTVRFVCDDPNTSSSMPLGRTRDGQWWAYATQGQSGKVVQTWPESDPSQRRIVNYLPQQYQPFALNALGDYLVRDNSSHDRDPGYAMLADVRYPDELTWGVSGAGLSGASIGIADDGTVLGGTVDVGVALLYRDGGVGGTTGFSSSTPIAIARNGDFAWYPGDVTARPRWTHEGKTQELQLSVGNWLIRKPALLSDRGELLFSSLPDAQNLSTLYLVFPADQPNPLGETALTLTAGAAPGAWATGAVELHQQEVSVARTLITWGVHFVSEGQPTRALGLAVSFGALPRAGDTFAVGGPVFAQWSEEARGTLSATAGTVRVDEVSGRTWRLTLTDLVFADGASEVLRLNGTLHTRGAFLQ